MEKFKVVEKFLSINGEGKKAGQLAVFIRLKGCNLCCSYCDTAWANTENAPFELLSAEEICDYILKTGVKNVTLTGGEPLLSCGVFSLIEKICSYDEINLEIETNGSIDISPYQNLQNKPSITMDYKLPDSLCEDKMFLPNFIHITNKDTVKFVISSLGDMEKALEIIKKYDLTAKTSVYFSAVFGKITPLEIVDFMLAHKLNDVNFQLQLHKYIWDPNKKGV